MEGYKSYNLNEKIRFELSDKGKNYFMEYYTKTPLNLLFPLEKVVEVLEEYKCKDSDFYEMQLHVAFEYFGGYKTMSFAKGSKIYLKNENLED